MYRISLVDIVFRATSIDKKSYMNQKVKMTVSLNVKSLLAFLILFFLHDKVCGQDPDCDFYQNVVQGKTYYIYSENYPNSYNPSSVCRWQAACPANTNCRINCTLEIPATSGCSGDYFLVSKSGDSSLTGADRYCGTGTLDITSTSNTISTALITTTNTPGGRFMCTLRSQSKDPGPTNCECGWKKVTRIVGGVETMVNEYPMMAALVDLSLRIVYCGSTIIHPRYVLTAAHCLQSQQVSNVGVLYGEHNTQTGLETDVTTLIRAQGFISHPNYNGDYDYDIGLIHTTVNIVYSDKVGPACLPFKYSATSFTNYVVQALGWGTTSFGGPDSEYLQKVDLSVVDQQSCTNVHGSTITPRTLCTFNKDKDACQHDSGGPLLWQDPSSGRVYLVGVIMGGYGCATSKPGLNSRVTEYLNWITLNTPGAEYCRV